MFKLQEQIKSLLNKCDNEEDKKKLGQAVASHPAKFFCPNGAQERLINVFKNSILTTENPTDIATIICTYANGVGKTEIIKHLIVNLINGPQNGWFDHEIFRTWKLPKRIWYCTTPRQLVTKVPNQLVEILEKTANFNDITIETSKAHHEWITTIETSNGWTIYFFSYNQQPSELEGDEVGLIINDEPAPESFDKAQKSRRRMGNITIHVMTPLYCDPYLPNNYKKAKKLGIKGTYTLEAPVYEACEVRGTRGHLAKERIDKMVEEYSEDEREARAMGRFMFYSTRIYQNFSRNVHVAKKVSPFEFEYHGKKMVVPKTAICKTANDPKDGTWDAVVYAWLFPNGRILIFDESPAKKDSYYWEMKESATIEDKISEFIEIERENELYENNIRIRRIIDKTFGIEQTRGGTNLATEYFKTGKKLSKELGIPASFTYYASHAKQKNKGMLEYRHEVVREKLKIQPDGMPNLIIADVCSHTIFGLENYIRKYSEKMLENNMQIDASPIPKYKDFPDAVGFLCADKGYLADNEKITKTETNDTTGLNW